MGILDKILANSGPIGACLVFLWVLSIGVIIERTAFWFFLWVRRNPIREARIMKFVKEGKFGEACKLANKSRDIFVRVFKYLLPDIPPAKDMDNVMSIALDKEFGRSHSFLRILNACAVIAPALGLLGTITGLTKAFGTMGQTVDMSAIAIGISEAMTTTFLGLAVAVVNLAASHLFGGIADRAISKIESKLNEFKLVELVNH
jgi:biopolymer transport protein ExbB|tara:strand:- start:1553 stop:2161 length:609 start_codon:yes stop_codon:yes gene_type:complete